MQKSKSKFSVLSSMQYFQNPNVFFFPNGLRIFNKEKSSISHWQLRDLIQCSPLFDELYYVHGLKIKRFPYPSDIKSFFDLDSLIQQAESSSNDKETSSSSSSSSTKSSKNKIPPTMDLDDIEEMYNTRIMVENQKKSFWKEHFLESSSKNKSMEIDQPTENQEIQASPLFALENHTDVFSSTSSTGSSATSNQNPETEEEEEEEEDFGGLPRITLPGNPSGEQGLTELLYTLAQSISDRARARRVSGRTSGLLNFSSRMDSDRTSKFESKPLLDLTFQPQCLAVGNNLIALGGPSSEIYVGEVKKKMTSCVGPFGAKSVKTEVSQIFNKRVGGSINNCGRIMSFSSSGPASGNPLFDHLLFTPNNDEKVKIFSIAPRFTCIDSINVGNPVNYVDCSPPLSLIACVSDSPVIKIFDIRDLLKEKASLTQRSTSYESPPSDAPMYSHRRSGATTPKNLDLNFCNECGFCCSFSSSGLQLATSCQGGVVTLWDLRKSEKELKRFVTTPKDQKKDYQSAFQHLNSKKEGANFASLTCLPIMALSSFSSFTEKVTQKQKFTDARIVKFCKEPPFQDLLVFAEHNNRIHIVDTKNDNDFENEQIIDLDKQLKWVSRQQKKLMSKQTISSDQIEDFDENDNDDDDISLTDFSDLSDFPTTEISGFDFSRDGEFLFVKTVNELFQFKINTNNRHADMLV